MTDRICRHCRSQLIRRDKEKPADFARRFYCRRQCLLSRTAASKLATHEVAVRVCPCGASYGRRAGERYSHFLERRFCRNDCRSRRDPFRHRSEKQVAAAQAWGRNGPVQRATFVHQPPPKGTKFESSAEWLKRHEPTRVAPAYCAPVTGAGR